MVHNRVRDPDVEEFRVLFVCTGNTCRSPTAEAIVRAEIETGAWGAVVVGSAGVAAAPGAPASGGALRAAQRNGLDLSSHESRVLTPTLVAWADLILTMSWRQSEVAVAAGGNGKTVLLTAYAAGEDERRSGAVPDPFGQDDAAYDATFHALQDLVGRVLARVGPILAP